jgi:hypothetical protein
MVMIGLRILIGFNILIGVYFTALAVWPSPGEKHGAVILLLLLWGFMFLGLAALLWMRHKFARMSTMVVYGLIGLVILMNLMGEFGDPQSHILQYPLIYILIYLLWLILAVGPVVFLLRHDVKEHFLVSKDS